jgi:hypothetical protein
MKKETIAALYIVRLQNFAFILKETLSKYVNVVNFSLYMKFKPNIKNCTTAKVLKVYFYS